MTDVKLDQYFAVIVNTHCRPGTSFIVEDKYNGTYGDIQVTGIGAAARFVGPTFKLGDKICIMTNLEVFDEEGKKPYTNLTVSMKDGIVKPVESPSVSKDYNFTLKATISGEDFVITSKKTLRVVDVAQLAEIEKMEAAKQEELIRAQKEFAALEKQREEFEKELSKMSPA